MNVKEPGALVDLLLRDGAFDRRIKLAFHLANMLICVMISLQSWKQKDEHPT